MFLAVASVTACSRIIDDELPPPPTPAATALYRVTFEATWSATTHPGSYPAGAHFSPLMGASHPAQFRLFRVGSLAGTGIKNMAELGNNTALRAEINGLIGQGKALRLLDGRSATASPGTLTDTIRLSTAHPALSVVTMIAPSPDWFAALDGEELLENGQTWAISRRVPAVFYDAGTDSGGSYTAADQPTSPPEALRVVQTALPPVGYFRLERIN
ncbi:spondin domain-containing protein [Hymenobacter sp. BT635]|uniref:Spondin domain-containing protein n=1 Tax=Hymenobacter nitidus TaxID=2880929 RepID=A0ABS8AEK1_9BACT|nr:spondin domain-containing protein [Hymenobacter nitidus]MCB2378382.1 spondin domain-containing protein [Hymenobacter nitidus]